MLKKIMQTIGESISTLVWNKTDRHTISQVEASMVEHVDWMQSVLPEESSPYGTKRNTGR